MAEASATKTTSDVKTADVGADSNRISWAFLAQYYSFLNKDPSRLHCFYTKRSTLIHSTEGEEASPCYGQQEIHNKIMSLKFEDCKVYISNVDSQSSAEGGIIVQVIGEQSNRGGPWRKFSQTFFLAEQPNGYFVLNDIYRYIKEEGDEEELAAAASSQPAEASTDASTAPESNSLFADATYSSVQDTFPAVASSDAAADTAATASGVNGTEAASTPVVEDTPVVAEDVTAAPAAAAPLTNGRHEDAEAPKASTSTDEPEAKPIVEPVTPEPAALAELASSPPPLAPVAEETPASIAEAASSEPAPAPTPTPAPETPAAASTTAAPAAAAPAPAAPKSWASLAASNGGKWGKTAVATAKGVSAAPTASTSSRSAAASGSSTPTDGEHAPQPPPQAGGPPRSGKGGANAAASGQAGAGGASSTFSDAVMAVTTPMCYIKGVQENVTEKALKDVLTSRFGTMCECAVIRSKACAFVEFDTLLSARKALQASSPRQEGGEGGVRIPVDPDTTAGGKDFTMIHIVERKEHGDRPPSQPRRGPGGGRGGGAAGGGGGGGGGAKGGAGKGGRGGAQQGSGTGAGRGGKTSSSSSK